MRRMLAATALCTLLFSACETVDRTPEGLIGVEDSDLSYAELPDDVEALAQAPMGSADATGALAFVADGTLAADGNLDAQLTAIEGAPAPAHFGRAAVVAVRWGYFPPRETDELADFSGSIAVSRGEI